MDILLVGIVEDFAMQHLRQSFSISATEQSLSRMLIARMKDGQFILVAKPGLDLVKIKDLSTAGSYGGTWIGEFSKKKGGLGNSLLLDFAYILNRLRLPQPQRLFVENIFGVQTSEYLSRFHSELALQDEKIYHVADLDDIRMMYLALAEANTVPFTKGFCTTGFRQTTNRQILFKNDLESIVQGLTLAFATALDGEGFLIWTPLDSDLGNIKIKLGLSHNTSKEKPEYVLLPYLGPEIELD